MDQNKFIRGFAASWVLFVLFTFTLPQNLWPDWQPPTLLAIVYSILIIALAILSAVATLSRWKQLNRGSRFMGFVPLLVHFAVSVCTVATGN